MNHMPGMWYSLNLKINKLFFLQSLAYKFSRPKNSVDTKSTSSSELIQYFIFKKSWNKEEVRMSIVFLRLMSPRLQPTIVLHTSFEWTEQDWVKYKYKTRRGQESEFQKKVKKIQEEIRQRPQMKHRENDREFDSYFPVNIELGKMLNCFLLSAFH